jgi:hypothetical protein
MVCLGEKLKLILSFLGKQILRKSKTNTTLRWARGERGVVGTRIGLPLILLSNTDSTDLHGLLRCAHPSSLQSESLHPCISV